MQAMRETNGAGCAGENITIDGDRESLPLTLQSYFVGTGSCPHHVVATPDRDLNTGPIDLVTGESSFSTSRR